MPRYNQEYKDVRYTIDTAHHPGGWTWQLRVGGESSQSQGSPWPTEELAITEAEDEACRRIDRGTLG